MHHDGVFEGKKDEKFLMKISSPQVAILTSYF